jgi:hypothetical protein
VESAARRRVQWTGDLTGKDGILQPRTGFNSGNRRQQNLGVGVRGLAANLFTRSHFHEFAKVHDTDAITEMLDDGDAMGNQ